MFEFRKLLPGFALMLSAACASQPLHAQTQMKSDKVPVTTVVTVLGPNFTAPPALGKADVVVHTGNQREDVTEWAPAQGEKAALELAILIDDGADINNQVADLRSFIQQMPKSTSVGLFYSQNGITQTVAPFSADHDAVAKKVRLTVGAEGTSMSLYIALGDIFSKWRASGARREVLLIGDGIDRFRGDPDSPDVSGSIDRAQKAGIIIHTLYAKDSDRASRNSFRTNWGQSNFAQITDATGGESFFQGLSTPISFSPFLEQLDMVLHNQYFLTFTTARSSSKKGQLRNFHVNTEQRNVEISAERQVLVPGPAQ